MQIHAAHVHVAIAAAAAAAMAVAVSAQAVTVSVAAARRLLRRLLGRLIADDAMRLHERVVLVVVGAVAVAVRRRAAVAMRVRR